MRIAVLHRKHRNSYRTNTRRKRRQWRKIAAAPLASSPPVPPPTLIFACSQEWERIAARNGMGDIEMMRQAREIIGAS